MKQKIKRAIVWFKSDLRISDNEALTEAVKIAEEVIPFYCLDDHYFQETGFGFKKTGALRARFQLESLEDLKRQLKAKGSDLVIRRGSTAEELEKLRNELGDLTIFTANEHTFEEKQIMESVRERGFEIRCYEQYTLYHPDDLPMEISKIPKVYTEFRKKVEKYSEVRNPISAPDEFGVLPDVQPGEIPQLSDLGLKEEVQDERAAIKFKGGSAEAWKRLEHYFFNTDNLAEYKETRNGLVGADYSSKFSAWLAQGCISPREIYEKVEEYESERKSNQSTYWLKFELIWRDFFRFTAMKMGDNFFRIERNPDIEVSSSFKKWKNSETSQPFVNANMKELALSGYMSNRGRQNVASYLVNDLNEHWYLGAAWFENRLIDFDVCSNYGNWTYVAGVGNDPRKNRYFNIEKQQERYDPKNELVKHWL